MSKTKLWILLLLVAIVAGCSKDEDSPQPESHKSTPFQMMVVFSPGQLGDKGYADGVMNGMSLLNTIEHSQGADSLNVRFIAPNNREEARVSLKSWAADANDQFYGGEYQRRLLVLTEPYMISWLADITASLRPVDEVLLMKVNEDDVKAAATQYGLGNRLHGLNISVAASIRKFCRYMEHYISYMNEAGANINLNYVPTYRLYDPATTVYRDSIAETLAEELGNTPKYSTTALSSEAGDGIYNIQYNTSAIELAYSTAAIVSEMSKAVGLSFAIVDLGAANAGWDYYMLGHGSETNLITLMLDANETKGVSRFYINRQFDMALANWGHDWLHSDVGTMSQQTTLISDFWCVDNIPVINNK